MSIPSEGIQAQTTMKPCTCGAKVSVRCETRRSANGQGEIIYRVACPVCGQLGPAILASGKDESTAIEEAIRAWNALMARTRPLET